MNSNSGNDLYNLNVATAAPTIMNGNDRFTLLSGTSTRLLQGQGQLQDSSNTNSNTMPTQQSPQQPQVEGGTTNVAAGSAAASMLNNRNGMLTSAATATASGGGGADSAVGMPPLGSHDNNSNAIATAPAIPSASGGDFQTLRASIASSNNSDDDAVSDAYRRTSKESLVSHESLTDMLHRNAASGGMDAAQQANLLNLLQRQQIQMGNLSVANHANNSVGAAMAMMATLQQQQQGGASGGGGTASHRNSMTGVPGATTVGSSFNMGGATDMNTFMMNMNYMGGVGGTHTPTTTVALNSSNHNNNSNEKQGPLFLIPPKKSKNKHKQTFSMKLMNILSLRECHSSIRWMPNGRSFCIVDSKILVEKVLPVYFKEAKYTSFTRKLNRWGFKHYSLPINSAGGGSSATAEKEMSIYSHDKFRRDDPELCQTMDGGHRRRNARKDEERTRQFYSQLKPEVRDLLRQGQGVGVSAGEEGASVVGSDQQLPLQAQAIAKQAGTGGASSTGQNSAGLEAQLQQMQAMQLQLLQQQQQMQQLPQQQQANQMMDMSSFMSNNAALMGAGASNVMAAAMGGNTTAMMNNSILASANQQGLMGMNMMGGGGGDNNVNTNAAMAAAAMTAAAGGQLNNSLGMRRTSLGFMPYLPASNVGNVGRRDSMGSVFSLGNNQTFDGKIESTFDDMGGGPGANSSAAGRGEHKEGYEPGTGGGGDQTSKMDVLQGLIANEQRKQQSLIENNASNNDGTSVGNNNFLNV
eukprot:scaffold1882_cov181-Skeletonema_marinoi.AAC.4